MAPLTTTPLKPTTTSPARRPAPASVVSTRLLWRNAAWVAGRPSRFFSSAVRSSPTHGSDGRRSSIDGRHVRLVLRQPSASARVVDCCLPARIHETGTSPFHGALWSAYDASAKDATE